MAKVDGHGQGSEKPVDEYAVMKIKSMKWSRLRIAPDWHHAVDTGV
jgi:hypothetical protein